MLQERDAPKPPVLKERERTTWKQVPPPVVAVSLHVTAPADAPLIPPSSDGPEVPRVPERVSEEVQIPKVPIEKQENKPKSERQMIYEELLKNF